MIFDIDWITWKMINQHIVSSILFMQYVRFGNIVLAMVQLGDQSNGELQQLYAVNIDLSINVCIHYSKDHNHETCFLSFLCCFLHLFSHIKDKISLQRAC